MYERHINADVMQLFTNNMLFKVANYFDYRVRKNFQFMKILQNFPTV